ncbi:MAG: S41 family peptidase [Thermoanaerobaculia bacterium]
MRGRSARGAVSALAVAAILAGCAAASRVAEAPPVLAEIDRRVRETFWDPQLKGADWKGAVARAAEELPAASSERERDRVYDRLLAVLADSHTFRLPRGAYRSRSWGTAGLRIGQDSGGYAVKGVLPDSPAARAGMKLGDRILEVNGEKYGKDRVDFRRLFLVFEGSPASELSLTWQPAGAAAPRTDRLQRAAEEPGQSLVWKSARVIRRAGRSFGYARLWGISAETALAVVDLLLDREEVERAGGPLAGWGAIEGFVLDVRGNSGGYDPNILATFFRGRWSAGDYWVRTREGRRLAPPEYRPLPVALLVNSGTASAGEALALKFRAHAIGPIVGETTAGMASGGAGSYALPDGSTLWITQRAIEDAEGRSYEGRGVAPDVAVADAPPARPGEEEAVVEAGLRALAARK